jgi:polysaccharide chain length determinant protein (PEP-CTERM system associated)
MNASRSEGLNIGYYVALVSRRRWFIIGPFCLAMIVGMALAIKLPKLYEASTLILVQPQRVPEKIVTPVVDTDIEMRINTISQQILSRSNLERVIEKFNLFSEPKQRDMFMEDKIESLRKRIKVEISRTISKKDTEAFLISYQDRSPQTTMRVANGLASFFIDENLKERETRAVGTSDFLESELEAMRRRLEEQEQILKKFREKNMGELPEQLDSNLKILERLNQQLSQKEESLRSARVSLAAIESEMAIKQSALAAMAPPPPVQATGRESEDQMSLDQLRDKLSGLRASYTDQHPDVVRLKAKIEKMEKEQPANLTPAEGASGSAAGAGRFASAQLNAEAARQRTVLNGAIRSLEGDIARINQEIRDYQRRVEATPKREQELLSLRRDYDNIKASYNSLLNRKLEADISVNMEKKQKGEQFQIIDPARLPEKPVSPNMPKMFMIAIAAGLGIGAGLVFLVDSSDTSVRRLDDFEEKFGMVVLASVPRIFNCRDKIRHRFRLAATAVSILIAIVLAAGFAAICFLGVDPAIGIVL